MTDAVTGNFLSTFNKTSGSMLGWGTALECNEGCTGTLETQYYVNSTIVLESADSTFIQTLGSSQGAMYTEMETADDGKTWTIAKITIAPMQSRTASASRAAEAVVSPSSSPVGTASSVLQLRPNIMVTRSMLPAVVSIFKMIFCYYESCTTVGQVYEGTTSLNGALRKVQAAPIVSAGWKLGVLLCESGCREHHSLRNVHVEPGVREPANNPDPDRVCSQTWFTGPSTAASGWGLSTTMNDAAGTRLLPRKRSKLPVACDRDLSSDAIRMYF
ncbi:hypothetical protein BDV96DRAFT_607563 [Lophiotrema nucula]|uniref:Uncharacterized protein n=1 Tax=Lophiotrema nucula TaxID=690887 RepID=A0A6A5YGP0_9PLEO|nr:hypothetical protein BDV96DRAFT_607563 [Lophiotrema nucula]